MLENFDIVESLTRLSLSFVPLMLGIILHEVAHGYMAYRFGDSTAKNEGRLTLNPISHIDPTGLMVFAITSLSNSFVFGWAKPVPVNYRNLRNPLKNMTYISAAGPLSNFLLALAFGIVLKIFVTLFPVQEWHQNGIWIFFSKMLPLGVAINCSLAWINLIPIPPLDGSKIIMNFIPRSMLGTYLGLERYGFMILILLLVTGFLGDILRPLVSYSARFIFTICGLI